MVVTAVQQQCTAPISEHNNGHEPGVLPWGWTTRGWSQGAVYIGCCLLSSLAYSIRSSSATYVYIQDAKGVDGGFLFSYQSAAVNKIQQYTAEVHHLI